MCDIEPSANLDMSAVERLRRILLRALVHGCSFPAARKDGGARAAASARTPPPIQAFLRMDELRA